MTPGSRGPEVWCSSHKGLPSPRVAGGNPRQPHREGETTIIPPHSKADSSGLLSPSEGVLQVYQRERKENIQMVMTGTVTLLLFFIWQPFCLKHITALRDNTSSLLHTRQIFLVLGHRFMFSPTCFLHRYIIFPQPQQHGFIRKSYLTLGSLQ